VSETTGVRVADDAARHRFEISVDGTVAGFAAYRLHPEGARPERIVFTHTEVDPAYEGQGLGSRLAAGALGAAKERGLTVVPQCPFIAAYLRRHPEYAA
jgi:predicted GNAT family acetyltransferase